MKKTAALMFSALLMIPAAAGCGKSSESSANASPDFYLSKSAIEKDFADVKEADFGPVLTISDTTAKPGGIAEVTLSVSNAQNKWSMCGLHITYPDVLKCVLKNAESRDVDYKIGPACEGNIGSVAKEWQQGLPEDVAKCKRGSVFFTAMFEGDYGGDGDIVTFYFNVPQNAKSGTVYHFDYYYNSSDVAKDMFESQRNDASVEKYAFTHWHGGTVTVE
jgi:hypothetical protein